MTCRKVCRGREILLVLFTCNNHLHFALKLQNVKCPSQSASKSPREDTNRQSKVVRHRLGAFSEVTAVRWTHSCISLRFIIAIHLGRSLSWLALLLTTQSFMSLCLTDFNPSFFTVWASPVFFYFILFYFFQHFSLISHCQFKFLSLSTPCFAPASSLSLSPSSPPSLLLLVPPRLRLLHHSLFCTFLTI